MHYLQGHPGTFQRRVTWEGLFGIVSNRMLRLEAYRDVFTAVPKSVETL